MNKLFLSLVAISLVSTSAFAQSKYEFEIYESTTSNVDAELATIFPYEIDGLGKVASTTIGGVELYVSAVTAFIARFSKAANGKSQKGLSVLAGVALLDGITRLYITLGTNKSPGFVPLASVALQQFVKWTDSEKAAFIQELKNDFKKCSKNETQYIESCYQNIREKYNPEALESNLN